MPKKIVPAMDAAESSSDDEAPEEIKVSSSRQQGLSQMKEIYQSEKKSRDEEREKRRKRNEIFRLQKEKKLQDLSKRKLPQDVLDAVSNSNKNMSQGNEGPGVSKKSKKDVDDDEGEEDEEAEDVAEEDSGDDRLSDSGVEDDGGDDATNDFIPLGNAGRLALATNEVLAKQKLTAAQKALNFKHSQLYNQPTIPRESTKQRRARMAKRKANNLR